MWIHPLLLQVALAATSAVPSGPFRAVVVGGGPAPAMNQVAIERHVRYFGSVLPPAMDRRVLFASGARDAAIVQVLSGSRLRYQRPELPQIDGPSTFTGLGGVWRGFVMPRADDPLLLYFAGHGTRNPRGDLDDNSFDLWGGGGLDVRQLAARIAELPPRTPVVVVMAQCYSGAFANLLFEGGRPDAPLVERDLVGFFAATNDRPASGCTPEVNEADYQDFSSHFFAALSGKDRLGRRVSGADFDASGAVGMDEAFAWATIRQDSGDVPVSTSDAFLRRFVNKPDVETMATPYATIRAWARPAQRAALEGLSARLTLRGEDRLRRTYDAYFGPGGRDEPDAALRLRFIRLAKSVVLAHVLAESGAPEIQRRFERLRAAEAQNPLLEPKRASRSLEPWARPHEAPAPFAERLRTLPPPLDL